MCRWADLHVLERLDADGGRGTRRAWRWPKMGAPRLQGSGGVHMCVLVLSSFSGGDGGRSFYFRSHREGQWFTAGNGAMAGICRLCTCCRWLWNTLRGRHGMLADAGNGTSLR